MDDEVEARRRAPVVPHSWRERTGERGLAVDDPGGQRAPPGVERGRLPRAVGDFEERIDLRVPAELADETEGGLEA